MRYMHWDWTAYVSAPVSVREAIETRMQSEAKARGPEGTDRHVVPGASRVTRARR